MCSSRGRVDDEPTCIWVLAGVLSYRPCDRAFECERCPLYHALRAGRETNAARGSLPGAERAVPPVVAEVNTFVSQLLAGCELHLDRQYSSDHLWLRHDDRGMELGVDAFALRVLEPIDEVVTARCGTLVAQGTPFGWIVRGRKTIPLAAPLQGEILEVNEDYLACIRAQPEPWLLRIRSDAARSDSNELFGAERVLEWYLAELRAVTAAIGDAVIGDRTSVVGATLADGGKPTTDLEHVLGRDRYEALVETLFHIDI